jgi:DNA-binding transcriptional regulator YiaG
MIATTSYLSPYAELFVLVAGTLSTPGTTSAPTEVVVPNHRYEISTSSVGIHCDNLPITDDVAEASNEITRQAICELRRISGLTWEQLGELFGVSRRTVHFWASGKSMNAENARQLMAVFQAVSKSSASDAATTRAMLFTVGPDGKSAFDLLRENQTPAAVALLGEGGQRLRPNLTPLSKTAQQARAPLSPATLVDSVEASAPTQPRPGRAARTVRTSRDKA